jgi:hypothetical protein
MWSGSSLLKYVGWMYFMHLQGWRVSQQETWKPGLFCLLLQTFGHPVYIESNSMFCIAAHWNAEIQEIYIHRVIPQNYK